MPYISKKYREGLDPIIERFLDEVSGWFVDEGFEEGDTKIEDGIVSFLITRIIQSFYDEPKYQTLMRAVGTLECVKQEWIRRRLEPREDEVIRENGDVY